MSRQEPIRIEDTSPQRLVTLRAVVLACALMPILALWVVQSELIWYSGHSTAISLFFHVTFVVFLLALGNLAVRQRWPDAALSGAELMTIYMMLAIAGTFCSHDLFQILSEWGPCDDCPEDINCDGIVDIDDIFAVLAAWGPC